jgi:acetyl-CoA acetyltransferase
VQQTFAGQAAIAGIGATEFSKASGRSSLRLAVEACVAACTDAGLDPAEVDGMVVFGAEENTDIERCATSRWSATAAAPRAAP